MIMEGEKLIEDSGFLAAPLTFFAVVGFQLLSKWLEQLKKKGSKITRISELQSEIKQLLREASAFSQPATFAQAAKLMRSAATKEKELAQYVEQHTNDIKALILSVWNCSSCFEGSVIPNLSILVLRTPVAIIAKQLLQPFGTLLSSGTGGHLTGHVMVGIIPWLILSTRVSKCVCRFVEF